MRLRSLSRAHLIKLLGFFRILLRDCFVTMFFAMTPIFVAHYSLAGWLVLGKLFDMVDL